MIWTLGEMLQSPSNATTVAALSPLALRGRYQGLNSLNWSAGTALAPILGGLTQQHLGNATRCGSAASARASWSRSRTCWPARPGPRRVARLATAHAEPIIEPLPPAAELVADTPVHIS